MAFSTHAANDISFRMAASMAFSAMDGRRLTDLGSLFSLRYFIVSFRIGWRKRARSFAPGVRPSVVDPERHRGDLMNCLEDPEEDLPAGFAFPAHMRLLHAATFSHRAYGAKEWMDVSQASPRGRFGLSFEL